MKRLLFSNQENAENANPLFTLNQFITLVASAPALKSVPIEINYQGNGFYEFSIDGFTYSMKEELRYKL